MARREERPGRGRSPPGLCLAGQEELVGGQDTMCSRGPAGRLSSTEKAAKLGYFGLKTPGGDRESLKGNVKKKNKKKVKDGKENESCCPRASM